MTKRHIYKTQGTCSQFIVVEIDDSGTLTDVIFTGGCTGNLQGITSLVRGMKTDEILSRLDGIRCGYKNTSCPDQLCRAIEETLKSDER